MKIAIIDTIGLIYNGHTLFHKGLGGSESAVISMARELTKIGFDVTVYNNCDTPGVYDDVLYTNIVSDYTSDIVIVSRTVLPFLNFNINAKLKILWLHDTFIQGDELMEELVVSRKIDYIFTLSDWHTTYILNANHGKRRMYEVLKRYVFQTRNGVNPYPILNPQHKPLHFVYNASATKGLVPLVTKIWPRVLSEISSDAHLTVIGGYYRMSAGPDEQEKTVKQLQESNIKNVKFTGVIPQSQIAQIVSDSYLTLYPTSFPETSGISTMESIYYNTPVLTNRFGALEETAIEDCCYLLDYPTTPNSLFPTINEEEQVNKFIQRLKEIILDPYLYYQKVNACNKVKSIITWDTIALQWKQFFYEKLNNFLSVEDYRKVTKINLNVTKTFKRITTTFPIPAYSTNVEKRIIVVSPFRNSKTFLQNNVESVQQQDYNNYLHVLIDDASDDNVKYIYNNKTMYYTNKIRKGAIFNQLDIVNKFASEDSIIMLLDGDDWLAYRNDIFKFYNELYHDGYEFTYGSCYSLADNIPLVAQPYLENKSYPWTIPYTHLRTAKADKFINLDTSKFKDKQGNWMMAGADVPLFYELVKQTNYEKIYCNSEIVCYYNDINPANDYKINQEEQTYNVNLALERQKCLL